ncbi:ATP-binding protein [Corynebacterium sp.]|uniref:ATP-binding protein n=1 Tax=Corynebacterium sp. TaxID=1720 RepID=UPI0026DBD427|nr:ATP-binding protein [Corynebacterium sp.]MDO5032859.1 ATP-binding protein [Corynebacterium sp.]
MNSYIRRGLEELAREVLEFSPILHVTGSRQVGKSTLTQHLGLDEAVYVTLDDPAALSLAQDDPLYFVKQGGDRALIIDEIQRLPELSLALKAEVDADRRPGRFVITGSSDFARGLGRKDSLAGRMVDLHLHPLAQQEVAGTLDMGTFVDRVPELLSLSSQTVAPEVVTRKELVGMLLRGGYPPVLELSPRMRKLWFDSYLGHMTVVEETLAQERAQPGRLQSLMRLSAAHQAGELVPSKLAREADIPASTVRSYLDTLARLFLLSQAKAWKNNLTAREVSKPKAWVTDSGLACWLSGQEESALMNPMASSNFGHLVEGFVLQELCAQQGWADTDYRILHWRESGGMEVDAIIEYADGNIVAVEVKSGSTVKSDHAKHLAVLREKLGKKFVGGFVLAPIDRVQPLGEKLIALPMSYLWRS